VSADLDILDGLFALTEPLTPSSDPKLRALVDEFEKIAAEAEKDATDFLDEQQKRKVLIYRSSPTPSSMSATFWTTRSSAIRNSVLIVDASPPCPAGATSTKM
jgi:hypothetical protein